MHDIEDRVRRAFPDVQLGDRDDATWQLVLQGRSQSTQPVRPRRHRWRVAVVALAACVLLSGVAIAAEPGLIDRLFPKGSGGDRMEVMREPRPLGNGKAEDLPFEVKQMAERLTQSPDPIRLDGYRVLLDHRDGPVQTIAYAFPTESGEVCNVWFGTFGSGGCGGPTFQPGNVIANSIGHFEVTDGWSTITDIKGLTTDGVKSVRVRLADGTIQDAIMGHNAFLWYPRPYDSLERYVATSEPLKLARPKRSEPVALVIEMDDGSIREDGIGPS